MPIYAYRCQACGFEQDVLQKLSDAPLTTCPSCGAMDYKKQVTAAGFQLKGSGWYVTDFRDSGAKPKTPAASAADPAAAAPASPGAQAAANPSADGTGSHAEGHSAKSTANPAASSSAAASPAASATPVSASETKSGGPAKPSGSAGGAGGGGLARARSSRTCE